MTIRDPILSNLWAEFVNKNRCISVRLVSRKLKALNFDNFDDSHNSLLWPEYFIDFVCERWIPCQALTSVLCLHYRPETVTLQYKRCVHFWNNFPCITSLVWMIYPEQHALSAWWRTQYTFKNWYIFVCKIRILCKISRFKVKSVSAKEFKVRIDKQADFRPTQSGSRSLK